MEALFLSVAAVISVYIAVTMLLPRAFTSPYSNYTQKALDRIYRENGVTATMDQDASIGRDVTISDMAVVQKAYTLPFLDSTLSLLLKAGLAPMAGRFLLIMVALFFLLLYVSTRFNFGFTGFLIALVAVYLLPRIYLKGRIERRTQKFINLFPDALDMIVRSVRSGFPLNTALRMIADNMEEPIRSEFKQVVDEVAYGRSLTEALQRLAARIDQPDIQFFVVVLSVQQESGGNLAEILTNLSTVIRNRKQLRLKIRAMTSEGRATGWVLGSLPVFIFLLLWFISPQHLQPLFETSMGHTVLGIAASLVVAAAVIVRQMIRIEV